MRRVRIIYPGGHTYYCKVVDAETGATWPNVLAVDFQWHVRNPRPQECAQILVRQDSGNEIWEPVEVASLGAAEVPA